LTWYPWWHAITRCNALWSAGRFDEADAIVAEQYRQALDDRSVEAQAVFASSSAPATVGERGRVRTAVRWSREAMALHGQLGRPLLARLDRVRCALALALAGEADEAADELEELDGMGASMMLVEEVECLQARAWTDAAAGDLRRARGRLERAVELADDMGDRVGAASALHGLARLGRAGEVRDRLGAVASLIEGDLAPARAAHTDALAHGDATGLEKVSHTFEAMGADLLAAEAAADVAVARRRAGEPREAAAAEQRAGYLAERCEGPVTPALQAIEMRARLTPAERETAVLAASGWSNVEIAEQLYLSRRTVENRLHRVYEKLGISGRDELAEALVVVGVDRGSEDHS
jgi:DNA-binding CsgD family transcriptional regulator